MNILNTIRNALKAAGLDIGSGSLRGVRDNIRSALASSGLGREPRTQADQALDRVAAPGQFVRRTHSTAVGSRDHWLYIPARQAGQRAKPLPLVVMLHGCTQSADDFAVGTQMNRLADQHGFLVLYPEQAASANAARCWNWFRAEDQVRQGGEPELIVGMVQAVVAEHGVDPQRIFVAGLSAGAAMAVILGETYPEWFAAVGAHSGLPYAAAHDIPSAMAAMKGRPVMGHAHLPGTAHDPRRPATQAVPVIVFHGDRDHTVQPGNGAQIAEQAVRAHARKAGASGLTTVTEQGSSGTRRHTRTLHTDASGRPCVEVWTLHGAGHAWSGGDAAGSFTDRDGPNASVEMLRFFLAQTHAPS